MWRRFSLLLIGCFAGALASCLLAVLLVDPLGVSPIRLLRDDVLVEWNRRFMTPRVVRSGDHDSYVVGTSTLHHVAPAVLEATLGGRFANTGTHGATPYEQSRVLDLILRQPKPPRMVVHGLDATWCAANPPRYHPESRFPDWLYDNGLAGHLMHLLNGRMLTLVYKRALIALGRRAPDLEPSGFHNDLPDDASWTAETVVPRLWGPQGPQPRDADPLVPPNGPVGAGTYPALDMLAEVLARAERGTRVVLVMMPVHLVSLPSRGSEPAARLSDCKARLARIARDGGMTAMDYLHPSALTENDENFWDNDHTRVGFGARFATDIAAALGGSMHAPDGVWNRLDNAGANHAAR